jgi:hypothetical protein
VRAMVAVVPFGGARPMGRTAAGICPAEASLNDLETGRICPAAADGALLESSGEPK